MAKKRKKAAKQNLTETVTTKQKQKAETQYKEIIIKVSDVKKTFAYGDVHCEALKGVSFDIPKGQFVSIVGRSGSGKSTLMHIMAGLETMTDGDITIDGTSIKSLSEKQLCTHRNAKTGFVFQAYFLEPAYTVYNNIAMPLIIGGVPKKERKALVENAAKKAGIDHKLKCISSKLSGGEKQRVAIARAIVGNPPIIFADEPCGNLDVANGQAIMSLLRELSNSGTTVVLVTHNNDDAKKTDRIITLTDGLVVSDEIV